MYYEQIKNKLWSIVVFNENKKISYRKQIARQQSLNHVTHKNWPAYRHGQSVKNFLLVHSLINMKNLVGVCYDVWS